VIGRLAVLSLLLCEGLMVATFAELLAASYSGDHAHAVAAWACCLVALAGFAVPRLIEGFEIGPRAGYALTGATGLLLIYLLVRITVVGDIALWDLGWVGSFLQDVRGTAERGGHEIAAGLLLLVIWARATMRASDDVEMETLPKSVTLPFALVTALVVLGASSDRSGEIARAAGATYVFAILALACSQLALSGATFGEVRAGSTAGILLVATAGVAVVGLLVIGLFVSVLGPVIGPIIGGTVRWTLTIILTPFAWFLTKLFEFLFRGAQPFPDLQQTVATTSKDAANPHSDPSTPAKVSAFFMRTLALVVLIAVAGLAATVFARLRKRRRSMLEDGRETSSAGDMMSDLTSLFRNLFRRKPPEQPGLATTEATRLYLEVLSKAEASGAGRPDGETAREFAPVLHQTFANPVTDEITLAFESARYAGREPDLRAIAELRRRWQDQGS
jgi:hypothetical protein